MIKILKFTEYLYLAVIVFSVYRVFTDWNVNRTYAYLFIFFAVVSTGMFFFRRTYRKRFDKRNQDNS